VLEDTKLNNNSLSGGSPNHAMGNDSERRDLQMQRQLKCRLPQANSWLIIFSQW